MSALGLRIVGVLRCSFSPLSTESLQEECLTAVLPLVMISTRVVESVNLNDEAGGWGGGSRTQISAPNQRRTFRVADVPKNRDPNLGSFRPSFL